MKNNYLFTYTDDTYIKYVKRLIESVENNTTNISKIIVLYYGKKPPKELIRKNIIVQQFYVEDEINKRNINYLFFNTLPEIISTYIFDNAIICDADIYFKRNFENFNNDGLFYSSYYPTYSGPANEIKIHNIKNNILKRFPSSSYNKFKFKMLDNFEGLSINGGFFGGEYISLLNRLKKILIELNKNKNELIELGFYVDEAILIKYFDYQRDKLLKYSDININPKIEDMKNRDIFHLNNKELYKYL